MMKRDIIFLMILMTAMSMMINSQSSKPDRIHKPECKHVTHTSPK